MQLELPDGRALGYAEYGAPGGKPVLHFHGCPSSRLEGRLADAIALRLGIRVIAVDRPGYGLSDFKSSRAIAEWPNDVVALADALGLERFAVMGLSGGGPYAAACAALSPERVTKAAIVSGVGPLDAPGAMAGMMWLNRAAFALSHRAPWLLGGVFGFLLPVLRRDPDRFFRWAAAVLSEADKAVLAEREPREVFAQSALEAFRAGTRGPARDVFLYGRPWGFRLSDIAVEVQLWQGEADVIVPVALGRHQAGAIPDCQARFFPGEGHFSLVVKKLEEILSTLTD